MPNICLEAFLYFIIFPLRKIKENPKMLFIKRSFRIGDSFISYTIVVQQFKLMFQNFAFQPNFQMRKLLKISYL